ncbi:Cuticle protein 19 [Orchesella cincta]|uniref:Cuticle protein 19 n=1 Tax=Orchesella cincta TaxID=48709 RepID=A0A1D2MH78_ORCCI|nr:Cuticle protein 19 [Orchesella cincta]
MKACTIAALLVVVAAASADHLYKDYYSHPKYSYNYGVADKHTGDKKSAGEVRDGHITKGYYELVQPDGVLRTVKYISTPKGGFQAQVINKGIAGHPAHYHHHGHHGGIGGGRGLGGRGGVIG